MNVKELSEITGYGISTLYAGARQGIFPFMTAFRKGNNKKYSYVIYPEKVKEYFGKVVK